MDDFATMNEAYDEFFSFEPKPVSQIIREQIERCTKLNGRPGLVLLSSSSHSTLMLRLNAQRI